MFCLFLPRLALANSFLLLPKTFDVRKNNGQSPSKIQNITNIFFNLLSTFPESFLQIQSESVSYFANKQTDGQINAGYHVSSSVELMKHTQLINTHTTSSDHCLKFIQTRSQVAPMDRNGNEENKFQTR